MTKLRGQVFNSSSYGTTMQKIIALAFLTVVFVTAVLLDHFGILGLSPHSLSLTRVMAIVLILGGVALIIF